MKNLFSVQPYAVGSKNSKSLAIVIPSEVVKKYQINTSTVFVLRGSDSEIVLSFVDIDNGKNETIPVDKDSSQATYQQVSFISD